MEVETIPISSSQPDFVSTWFQFFNKEFVRNVSFADHEAFDNLLHAFWLFFSNDIDPINKFVDLFNMNQCLMLLLISILAFCSAKRMWAFETNYKTWGLEKEKKMPPRIKVLTCTLEAHY
ncbi:unnamed protein product [Lactuca virosa]|uniref:Uncharacterized protein n=1 Tax=Lactuca virosa TaxID=75947 RepID=A0AAU9LPW0_9ASTR|nr:unnamed protein product [Lactuca virosa]